MPFYLSYLAFTPSFSVFITLSGSAGARLAFLSSFSHILKTSCGMLGIHISQLAPCSTSDTGEEIKGMREGRCRKEVREHRKSCCRHRILSLIFVLLSSQRCRLIFQKMPRPLWTIADKARSDKPCSVPALKRQKPGVCSALTTTRRHPLQVVKGCDLVDYFW